MKYRHILIICFLASTLISCDNKIGLPRPDHIIVIIEENHGYDQIIGSEAAPYINQLAKRSAVFTDAHGVTHPSQPNYLAIFSGSIQGVTNDHCLKDTTPFHTPNIGSSLIEAGLTFKGYAQSMPISGFLGCYDKKSPLTGGYLYGRKHAPWINWQGMGSNNIPDSLSQPMSEFPEDFSRLPNVSFVIPDMDHDMHNIGIPGDTAAIQRGDNWLKLNIDRYVQWAKNNNSLLILTFDEDQFTKKNHILTLFSGAMVNPGYYPEKINHFNVLHTIEAMYNLTVSDTTHANIIQGIWRK